MNRPLALLSALMLSGCMVPDHIAQWDEGCDFSGLAGKTALVAWAESRAEVDAACSQGPIGAWLPLSTTFECTLMRPEKPAPGFDHALWESISGIIVTTPEMWLERHASCHVALGPDSRNHPPHGGKR